MVAAILAASGIGAACVAQVATAPASAPATAPTTTRASFTSFDRSAERARSEPYPGLELTYLRYDAPRPLRTWVARIDLARPGIEFVATCGAEVSPEFETRCETTLEFARRVGVQLAVNASAFEPFRKRSGEPMQVVGLGACDGHVYSPPDPRFAALIVTRDRKVLLGNPPYETAAIDEAVSGFHMLVDDGRSVVDTYADGLKPSFVDVNPRTAAATDREGTVLWLGVFDGRQPGVSEGITLRELAQFFLELGAYDALNLDGGGSTTMVLQDPRTREFTLVHTPSGRDDQGNVQLRLVANNFGLRIQAGGATSAPASLSPRLPAP